MAQKVEIESTIQPQNTLPNLVQKLKWFLNSNWALLLISVIVSVFWAINVPIVSIIFLTIFVCLIFTICRDNPKAFLLPFLSLLFCFHSLPNGWQIIVCAICAVIAIGFLIYFLVWKLAIQKTKCTKGNMFWTFLILALANLLGGVIGHFNIVIFCIVLASFVLLYGIYWFYLNFTKDCQKYFAWCAIFLSLIIALEILFSHIASGNFIQSVINKGGFVGVSEGDAHANNINSACIVMLTGLCACFYLALKNKKDYLYLLMALLIDVSIFFSYSRIVTFVAAIVSLICLIYIVIKSQNRKILLISLGVIVGVLLVFVAIFWNKILNAINYYLNIGFSLNGRGTLWKWCIAQFKNSPIFGIGFITNEAGATLGEIPGCGVVVPGEISMVYAHNFFLHHFVCVGIIGSLLTIPFYVKKYEIIFKKFTTFKLYVLVTSLTQLLASMVDSTYTSNLMLIAFVILLISSAEKITYNKELDELDEKSKLVTQGADLNTNSKANATLQQSQENALTKDDSTNKNSLVESDSTNKDGLKNNSNIKESNNVNNKDSKDDKKDKKTAKNLKDIDNAPSSKTSKNTINKSNKTTTNSNKISSSKTTKNTKK